MSAAQFAILSLAVWRVSLILAVEHGPRDVFARFRAFVGVSYDERSAKVYGNLLAEMIDCVWCNSFWIGLTFTILYVLDERVVLLALPLALSAVSILLRRLSE